MYEEVSSGNMLCEVIEKEVIEKDRNVLNTRNGTLLKNRVILKSHEK